jgi:hypothetical protein
MNTDKAGQSRTLPDEKRERLLSASNQLMLGFAMNQARVPKSALNRLCLCRAPGYRSSLCDVMLASGNAALDETGTFENLYVLRGATERD